MKKRSLGVTLIMIALALLIVGLAFGIPAMGKSKDIKEGNIKDINQLAMGELQKGDLVQGTFDTTWGYFAEEYETTYGLRLSKDSTKLYYLIDMVDYYLIYETAVKSQYSTLDEMSDELYLHCEQMGEEEGVFDNWNPTIKLEITGSAVKANDEIRGYCKEALDDLTGGMGEEEMEFVETYMVSYENFDTMNTRMYVGFGVAGVGLLLLIIAVVLIIRGFRNTAPRDEFY